MAGVVMVVVTIGMAVAFFVFARRVETGQTTPNMGHHTRETTTPESWAAAIGACNRTLRVCGWLYMFTAAGATAATVLAGSGSGVVIAGAGLGVTSLIVVVGSLHASGLLETNGSITR